MPRRLRTLPDRHGGRVVLALLALVLVIGLALRLHAALTPPADPGNDASAYMQIAKGLYEDGHYGGRGQASPNDWSPGAPLLYGAVYYVTGGVHPQAALIVVAILSTITILLTYLLGRRLAGPVAGLIAALLAATYPAFIDNTGRMLAEPVALVWLPAAMLAFFWATDGGSPWRWLAPGALLGLTTLTRPEYLPFVAVFALLALLRVWLGHKRGPAARRRRGRAPGGRLLRRARPVDGAQLPGAGPLRARHDRRREGVVRRHLPARRGPPAARQAPADRPVLRQEGPPLHRGPADGDGAAAQPRRRRSTRTSAATPRWRGSAARTSSSTRASSPSTTRGW